MNHYQSFKNAIKTEYESLYKFYNTINEDVINNVIESILKCQGKIVVTGIGKSGLIGKKIAATLSSTGTKSVFIHSTEAYHGDLGLIDNKDFVILLSYSGYTDEVLKVLHYCNQNKIRSLSITGDEKSILAKSSNLHIKVIITSEACDLKLAPTSSTTVTLAIGDAIAISLMRANNITNLDFAKFHPGGSLGKKLLLKAKDVMSVEIPKVSKESSIFDVIKEITLYKKGVCLIYDDLKLLGLISDGDIRRFLSNSKSISTDNSIVNLINTNPIILNHNASLNDCEIIFKEKKINSILVSNATGNVIGIIESFMIWYG